MIPDQSPPIGVEDLAALLMAANPCPHGGDEVAWAYHWLSEAAEAMPVVDAVRPFLEARGYRRAVAVAAAALATAQAEPRRAGPTERAGRITALGQLLADLEANKGEDHG